MIDKKFSQWTKWDDRNSISGIKYPGIYCIAISETVLSEQDFEWIPKITYVGMTNSKAGLKGRLKQFDNTIIGKNGHGGADRFRFQYENYQELVDKLYVSVCSFECDVKSNAPNDLRIMGEVAKFEYDCFAEYVDNFGCLPEFNNKKTSPKYSLTHK
ncbi:hypothetical protein EV201_0552 [Ancylomarina subtilis]|uniref:GIY-YIG domain-containing protein n=1 Tax=Ancylomarina subtilis TaxID=1639035 RepID=A0A4Q7VIP4_9BACT|nr:hypothetical protein [Ancylomarina subtilis]RZT95924.1 hypothetical protein EV201_0552 [Ancylomarina subtilis]